VDPRWLCFIPSLVISLALTAALRRWAPALGLVDLPDPRKVHKVPTPKGGGLAIFAATVLTALCWPGLFSSPGFGWLLLLAAGVVLLGVADDRWQLPWQLRLGAQALIAYLVVPKSHPFPSDLITVFWIVGLINAFNMLDNMDALSAGVAWIVLAGFLAFDLIRGHRLSQECVVYLVLLGAIAGFLWFNRPPASIFMGDAGSTLLGFMVAIASNNTNPIFFSACFAGRLPRSAMFAGAVTLLLCAVPWYDLISVVLIRLSQGRSPFHADKQHLSHRLVMYGLKPTVAVGTIHLLTLASGGSGVVLYFQKEPEWLLFPAGGWVVFAFWDAYKWLSRPDARFGPGPV
jgi:UDP-GlcNAc:undecaprenyl-phosphate GlcNAc-1-phosphate transferase